MNVLADTEIAIQTFYHSQVEEQRNEAHRWLLELQKSPQAWQVSLLLLDATKPTECQYYGAVILHYKICHMMTEVGEKEVQDLKNKLVLLISSACSGAKFVRTKLCSIFAVLVLQTMQESETLLTCITHVSSHFQNVSPQQSKEVILQILIEFPSQFKNLNMDSSKRLKARDFMVQFAEPLLSMWNEILAGKDVEMKNEALSCMLGWIGFGISALDIVPLIPILLNHIETEELTSKVCEVISDALTDPSSYSLVSSVFESIEKLLLLEPLIEKALQDENDDFAYNVCMMMANIGETHSNILVATNNPNQQMLALRLTKLILKFSSMPGHYPSDETCSRLTLTFWYHLQDDLVDVTVTDFQKQFQDAFLMLVDVYFVKGQYPPDEVYNRYTSEEKELFRCYRIDIQDTIMYLHHTLRDRCLSYFIEKLSSLLSSGQSTWQQYESVLYLLSGTTGTIDSEDKVYMPNIIQLLKKVPNHPKIHDTLYTFLGGLGEWLIYNQNHIEDLLPFLLSGMNESNNQIMSSCSLSLQDICQECAQLLSRQSVMKVLQVCRDTLQRPNCPAKVCVRLFQVAGYVISVLPASEIRNELEIMVAPLLHNFKSLLGSKAQGPEVVEQICHCLNCLTAMFRSLDPFEEQAVHPISIVYEQLLQILPLIKGYCTEEIIMLAATGCVSKAVEIVREKLAPFVNATCQLLFDCFSACPMWCIMNTASLVIGMFGSEEITSQAIKEFFVAITTSCLNLNSADNTDSMQGLMEMMTKVIRTVPEFFFEGTEFQEVLVKRALELMTLQETPTIKSTCHFVVTYLGVVSVYDTGKEVFLRCGKDIIGRVLLCIGVTAPRSLLDNYSDVLLAINKNFSTESSVWLNELLLTENFPTSVPTQQQKELFRKMVIKERSSKNRLRETVRNFALLCRGLMGLTYVQ
ncbi:importin-13-like [Clytia hemisphaerica]|uniref:Importin-13 n=1 Tax=Clytia hemisphaerica TaxID=252671 RepID=A0A7M5UYP6_9CNID